MTVKQRKIGVDPALELNEEDYSELLEDITAEPASDTFSESKFWQTLGSWGSK